MNSAKKPNVIRGGDWHGTQVNAHLGVCPRSGPDGRNHVLGFRVAIHNSKETVVLRGGPWLYDARDCRFAYRAHWAPGIRYRDAGFRLAAHNIKKTFVLRGGCWGNFARYCRSVYRYHGGPGGRDIIAGFRLIQINNQRDNQMTTTSDYESQIRTLEESIKIQIDNLKQAIKEASDQPAPEQPTMIEIPNRDYAVSETPVTVAQYRAFCTSTNIDMPRQPEPHNDNNPVVNVTWRDAQAYTEWLSTKTKTNCTLLAEDEFEYCCADHKEATPETAVYGQDTIQPVRTKEPNKFGLYDMLGLVWEWQRN